MSEWVTYAEAADRAHVWQATVRQWRHRGLLAPVGYENGRPLFALAAVLEVERATRRARRRALVLAKAAQATRARRVA